MISWRFHSKRTVVGLNPTGVAILRLVMIVWRLEDFEGKGFYRKSEHWDIFEEFPRHPLPGEDFSKRTGKSLRQHLTGAHLFGFTSIKSTKTWFNKPSQLEGLKVKLVAYKDYTRLHIAERQCIFIPKENAKKAVFDVDDLHKLTPRQLHKLARENLNES